MKRSIGKTTMRVALCVIALPLAGCFNNFSGLDEDAATGSGSSSSALLNDSGFANETGPIDTNAVILGTYNDSSGNGYGILIDLQKSLVATLGQDSVTTILSTIDTSTSMQARQVTVHIPSFAIKATTTLGKIAAGNNGKMRNIMNIRPRLVRVDLTSSALDVPASPHVLQLNNANKTVITYGGMIEGDYIRRMTVLIPFAGVNAGFLPSTAVPTYGDGYPAATPAELSGSVKLIPLSGTAGELIRDQFAKVITKPPYGQSIFNSIASDAIKAINQTYGSLALAVHLGFQSDGVTPQMNLDGTRKIDAAYLININPANNSGPETFTYCHSGYDSQDQTAVAGQDANGQPLYDIQFTHPLACNCPYAGSCVAQVFDYGTSTLAGVTPSPNVFVDPWPATAAKQNPTLIANAIAATAAAPTTGSIIISTPRVVNDFTLSQE